MDLLRRKHNNILLHVVNLGERKVSIPVATLGNDQGKHILITAGLDGDEYAGIEAAYALIEQYSKKKLHGRLTIIPIVNIPGFENASSWNPIDNKYPKHIFPGKEKGSATERLMQWLSSNFVKDIDLWIDLHSGASTEVLNSFVETTQTKYKKIQSTLNEYMGKIKADIVISDNRSTNYSENIAKRGIPRIVLESGQLGQRNKNDSKQQVAWVKQLLGENNQRSSRRALLARTISVYEYVDEMVAQKEGIWVPIFFGKQVKKSMLLGEIKSLDGKVLQKIIAKENGVFLWRREAMSCQKFDSLYAYAHTKKEVVI